ncbi:MAG: ADP-ribosylglycohydrolase family protein [Armatimonadetes bacterium]|nr:ADP-ribosylglycohydrolase family protein [Armatimonadota bacterium]
MPISSDYVTSREYEERVYAGVLGKIIGVYLGRPFEGWSNEHIEKTLGEVNYYVHEKLNAPLIVTDDDISGTFTFLRALPENGNDPNLTPAQIGDWWLNSIIEGRTILWWGGLGVSTEHTAYLRLKAGLKAPESGSIAANGPTVAEQIGAQIFIDGWGMVCPGDPERAADLARRAASVSHDGEAIYGAQVIAAMEAAAFAETNLDVLLDTAAALIPKDSVISHMIGDMREWAAANGDDWRATLRQLQAKYGYDRYGGGCHMVPNHAVVLLGLLHGKDDFQRALMVANTAGYDTDCNSGNVGCLMGIRNGLAGIDTGPDWRGPVADRLYLPTADGGRAVTDALRETYQIVNVARALASRPPIHPKNGARFHFSLPGSVQGFRPENSPEVRGAITVDNQGGRLALHLRRVAAGRPARVATATFTPPDALRMGGYGLPASPTLYPGQTVRAAVAADGGPSQPVNVALYVRAYDKDNALSLLRGPQQPLSLGQSLTLEWVVPDTGGQPVAEVGLEVTSDTAATGTVLLDSLTWGGVPNVTFRKPDGGNVWERAWINAATEAHFSWVAGGRLCRVVDNHATGLLLTGEWEWADYTVSAEVLPHLCRRAGLAAAVRGLHRYVAVVLDEDKIIRLIQQRDGDRRVLAESARTWEYEKPVSLSLTVTAQGMTARADGETLTAAGVDMPARGGIGLLVDQGHAEFGPVRVEPA